MKCSEVNEYLDMLMDDIISDEMRSELETHAQNCPRCAENIFSTIQLKDMLSDIQDEVDVPLVAQAAWRKAVKQEAARIKTKRFYRKAGSVAAAAVVLAGIGFAIGNADLSNAGKSDVYAVVANEDAGSEDPDAVNGITAIESDGTPMAAMRMNNMETGTGNAIAECNFVVDNVDTACSYIEDLLAEYEGTIDDRNEDGGKVSLYVSIPSEDLDAFLSAAKHLDESGTAFDAVAPVAGDMTALLLTFN